ncbi:alpha-2-macroglobulin family protein [Flavobacterium sp. Fl-318]|uniref:Alpha-2-macroglobulin family protein n=1 Tax=Flavobacterium cupriresistens TaxID=2893885 RepID=A0ABU4RFE7_9FLAO|nr:MULTISPECIES: alpha-2-macroglobulin family protein [unclassified Flavobacterium]MDX6190195.1 alpha-2-macroglobulin family protein [Flavobacterium sp. Fl-318]UFH43013.1 carboxypeptidase-like regulatory domain-containing protein [Flavobacterium sp. F-323]
MKNILFLFLLLSTTLFGQQNDKKWDNVVFYEKAGKIKSANEIVAKIYKKAVLDKDEVQIIKCFFYQSKYMQILEENAQTKIVNNLKKDISRITIPSRAILNLVYAKCLDEYFTQNRYQINNRTNTVTFDADFLTWTEINFKDQINSSLKQTLENENILKNTSLSQYKSIFDYSTKEKFKTNTLFHYILKEYIFLFKQRLATWEIKRDQFLNYKKELYGKSDDFTKINFDFVSSPDLQNLLLLYQKLEKNTPSAENTFDRVLFCKNFIFEADTDYINALTKIQKSTTDTLIIQKTQLEKAEILIQNAFKDLHSDYKIKAVATLDSILKINNRSNAYKQAIEKKHYINSKSLQIQLEKYTYPDQNTRAFLTYKNVDSLKISFYKIDLSQINFFHYSYAKKDSVLNHLLLNHIPVAKKNYILKNPKDYFEHTTEIILPNLKTGNYVVFFESNNNKKDSKAFASETLTVSNFTVLTEIKDKKEYYQVLDRKSGQPIENVKIQTDKFTGHTDKTGILIYEKDGIESSYLNLTLTKENDSLALYNNQIQVSNEYRVNETTKGKVKFYLDRAIYRPGQTVYFKGIAFQKKATQSTIVSDCVFKISILDANRSVLKEFNLTSNEYGSFSGEFTLPKNGITGNFSITAERPKDYEKDSINGKTKEKPSFWDYVDFENSSLKFRMEEYKKPTFEISIDPLAKTYAVNQKVTITGNATSFTGANITDAKVSYEIRQETYKINRYDDYEYYGGKLQIISQSETKTDNKGKFTIDFIAKPDPEPKKETLPIFSYRIRATVTDINGETHTIEQLIGNVGYHGLKLKTILPSIIKTKEKNTLKLESENLNGVFAATQGEIKIYCLRKSENKFKPRIWEKPEIQSISDTEFDRLFPFEQNKKPLSEKETGELVYTHKVDTGKNREIPLDFMAEYPSGNYKVTFVATDQFNTTIENSSLFNLIHSSEKTIPNQLFTVEQTNSDPKKDGFLKIKIHSKIPNLYINGSAYYRDMSFFEENVIVKDNEASLTIPLQKEFENTITIYFTSVFDNAELKNQLDVTLKNEEPKLQFEIKSFRNKIEPGKPENWSFKLSASNTTLESEILAAMYDKSLDQFDKEDWHLLKFPNFHSYYNSGYKNHFGFQKTYSSINNLNTDLNHIQFYNQGTELMWFGFNFNNTNNPYSLKEYENYLTNKAKKPSDAKMVFGIVSDNAEVLPGITIKIKGTNRATTSDFDGYYQIEAGENENLEFSYPGYKNQIKTIGPEKEINIILEVEDSALEKVIVVGYGIRKVKKSFAASVVEEDNSVYSSASASLSLEERITGLQASKNEELNAILQVKPRKNLSETAFFLPHLKTDAKGNVSFNFTSPEALTSWKLRLLAHNKEAASGYLEKTVITQKDLMVLPNFPRFLREKDTIVITAKISNITNEVKTGIAILQFFDATTMEPIDAKMLNAKNVKNFSVGALGNTTASWTITIPEGLQGVQYKILAKSGNFSDGEENILPVLTNNMLVTESIPIWVRENSKKEYTFENLKNNTSTTLRNHQFTLEYTSNPSWIAIQSLPYLMEYEHECAEQTFARFYANALATEIISSNPKIATVFENWRKKGKLNSKLEENEELKSILLAETPWFNDAQTEDEKKKNIALLFDLEKMKVSQETTFKKLKQKQKSSGGFPWFDGSDENNYITRHILAGLGHLSKLSKTKDNLSKMDAIAKTAIPYLDQQFLENYKLKTKNLKAADKLLWINPNADLHHLYARSFYLENYPLSDTLKKASKMYLDTAKKNWLTYSLYEKGLAALTLNRFGDEAAAKTILESLKETASNNEDWGMYWIANKSGWYWYQAPIETQALLIEAFSEINNDTKAVDAMKVWLLKNKQTKNWPTTKSTTEAIYALLLQGTDWLSVKDNTVITLGDEKIMTKKLTENEKEAETGYLKLNWKADEVKKEMATVKIENKSNVPGFGGIYWQYFEDLDKIKTNTGAVLSVSKELYHNKSTIKGNELEKITAEKPLQIGDLITVRLLITSKEDTEFVHLKDMRASCFEPVDVLSKYQYRDGLGYYTSTKDAATHLFFDKINKGTYVIEYNIRVNNSGEFSNGITTIESMYAPEFTSHTRGIRVKVK